MGKNNVGEHQTPFSLLDVRPPSEWHAAFGRSELSNLMETTKKMNHNKMLFIKALKPQYQKLMVPLIDPEGERAYAIWLILPKQEQVNTLATYLKKFAIAFDPTWWRMHYLP